MAEYSKSHASRPGKEKNSGWVRVNDRYDFARRSRVWEKFTNVWEIFTNVWENFTNVWEIFTNVWEIFTIVWEIFTNVFVSRNLTDDDYVKSSKAKMTVIRYQNDRSIYDQRSFWSLFHPSPNFTPTLNAP